MRSRVIVIFLCAAPLFLAACGTPPPGPVSSSNPTDAEQRFMVAKEVRDADNARIAAIERGDFEGYLAAYLEDAVWIPPHSQEVIGLEMARLRAREVMDQVAIEQTIDTQEQTIMSPDWVLDRGRYTMKITPKAGGEPRYDSGPFLTVWRRDADGKWKIAFDMWGSRSPIVETGQAK